MNDLGEILIFVLKIAGIVFTLIHFLAVLFLLRQVGLAVKEVKTNSYKGILTFTTLHVIILFIILLIIVILPVK